MTDPVLPNQRQPGDASMEQYGRTLESLKALSDDELRRLATDAGIDGADAMDRDHLIAKLIDEPGANDI